MTMKTMKLALAAVAVLGVGAATAQEMGAAPAVPQVAESNATAPVADNTVTEKLNTDGGEQIVKEATSERVAPKIAEDEKKAAEDVQAAAKGEKAFVSAEEIVKKTLRKELNIATGYDSKKKAMIVIGVAEVKIPDPANDKKFISKRNVKTAQAFLDAKAQIIRAISQRIETFDCATTAVEDTLEENLRPEEVVFKKNFEEFKKKNAALAKKLAILDAKEAEALNGVTLNDQFGAILTGIAKKLDAAFDPATISADKIRVRDEVKAECARLEKELEVLKAECAKLPKRPNNELESKTKLTSSMPLLGATVLTQAESWDKTDGTYQVALGVVWSRKLQDVAKRTGCGDFEAGQKKGKYSKDEWMAMQDLRCMLGPRKMTDNEGRTIYMGIAAADMMGTVASRRGKRRFAEVDAQNFVVFSLFGDVVAYTETSRKYKEYSNEETDEEFQTLTENLLDFTKQKFSGDIKGSMPLSEFAGEVIHPISGRKMYVVPYYLDPSLAKDSVEHMLESYNAAAMVDKAGQFRTGLEDGMKAELKSVREAKGVYNEGVKVGRRELKGRIDAESKKNSHVGTVEGSKDTGARGKNTGGAFKGDKAIDVDF